MLRWLRSVVHGELGGTISECASKQVFDLYYDRAPKNADSRKGAWFLYREMVEIEE